LPPLDENPFTPLPYKDRRSPNKFQPFKSEKRTGKFQQENGCCSSLIAGEEFHVQVTDVFIELVTKEEMGKLPEEVDNKEVMPLRGG
jgi:hypothetical protein